MHNAVPSACPPPDHLRNFLRGHLSDPEIDIVSRHLKACPACLARLDRLDRSEAPLVRGGSTAQAAPDDPALQRAVERLLGPGGFPADRPADPLLPGDRLGEYRLLQQVGEGGMGTTYKALHARLEMVVALKVLRPLLSRDPAAVARFHREMRAIGRLRHPNIVQATDAGEARGLLYLVMEFLTGETLSQRIRRQGALPVAEACRVVRAAARALQHAHANGLVHRDVKPSNLMLAADGTVKLLDLGLALLHRPADSADTTQLSAERGVVGTNDYMAPEQWRNSSKVDARADQYSLGCTLYYLLTGEPPFARQSGGGHFEKMEAHLTRPAPDPSGSRPDIPPELAAVVRRMLAKDPDERYADLDAVAAALEPFADEPTAVAVPTRRWWAWPAVAAGLLLAVGGVALGVKMLRPPDAGPPEPAVGPPTPGRLPMTPDEAAALQRQWADHLGRPVVETRPDGMDLVLIPPGEFDVAIDQIRTRVVLTRPFDLGRTEVTHRQFAEFVAATGYQTSAETAGGGYLQDEENKRMPVAGLSWRVPGSHDPADDRPVVQVSWSDAMAYCAWRGGREGRTYRLPTEWEWQWAGRAGSDQRFFHGPDPAGLDAHAWYAANVLSGSAQPVGQRRPNAWGLHDTLGNVWEWAANYRTTLAGGRAENPTGVPREKYRNICGGGFDSQAPSFQLRAFYSPSFRFHKIGFRVLREVPAPQTLTGQ